MNMCEYLRNKSLDLHKILCGSQLLSCEFKFRISFRSLDKCECTICKHACTHFIVSMGIMTSVRAYVNINSPPQQSMYGVPHSQYMLSFNVVHCPHPIRSTHEEGMCSVPLFHYKYYNVILCLCHTWLCLGF